MRISDWSSDVCSSDLFSCSVADPCLDGVVRGKDMTYENQIYGTKLTNIVVNGRFTGNRLEIEQLTAKAGDGTVQAKGFVSLASADGYPMNIAEIGRASGRERVGQCV